MRRWPHSEPLAIMTASDDRIARLKTEFDPSLPLEQARTIPARWYCDPEIYQLERDRVFATQWCVMGRADQVAQPGQFMTFDMAGFPIVVLRDGEGILRGFFNICRHRAAPILASACGQTTKLRCRYHGWTYDLRGQLRGTPEFEGVANFCRDENGLIPIEVATWGPLVSVRLRGGGPDFVHHLGPLPDWISLCLDSLEFVERKTYDLACNWKVYVDNYLDGGYHINTVHPELAGMMDYSKYRTEVFETTSVQTSPLETDAASVRRGMAQYWYVFPNFMLNLYDDVMDTNIVLPLGVDRCRVVFDFYFAKSGPASSDEFRHRSLHTAHRIQMEDVGICEEVQRGLASGVFDTGRFSVKREMAGYHFHRLLAQSLFHNGT